MLRGTPAESLADNIFRLHPKIRWAACSTEQGEVLFSKTRDDLNRDGLNSYDAFMELRFLVMWEAAEHIIPAQAGGTLENMIINLSKASVLIAAHGSGHLALSVDREEASRIFTEIIPRIKQLST